MVHLEDLQNQNLEFALFFTALHLSLRFIEFHFTNDSLIFKFSHVAHVLKTEVIFGEAVLPPRKRCFASGGPLLFHQQ